MNEKLLETIYNYFKDIDRNTFAINKTNDRLQLAKNELKNLGVSFKSNVEKKKERLYINDNDRQVLRYTKDFYPNNSMFGFKICNDKFLTERFLSYNNISTTKSAMFTKDEFPKAVEYIKTIKEPFVVKPLNLSGSEGVFLNSNHSNFEYIWNECVSIQKNSGVKMDKPRMLIQNQVDGIEVRFIITEGRFMSATLRLPPYIIGNGEHSIEKLINQKNKSRENNPYLKKNSIKVTKELERILLEKNKSLNTILLDNEFCILYPQSNIARGGENIEVTDLIHPNVIKLAEDSVLAIPGLHTGGVDIILGSLEAEEATVIEVNKSPHLQMNYYPYIGEPKNPLREIFKSILLDDKLLHNKVDLENIDQEEFEILKERYIFLYKKDKMNEEIIKNLKSENDRLKNPKK